MQLHRTITSFARVIAQPLVTTSWLAQNIENGSVVVLDGTWHLPTLKRNARKEFEASRIKGARFFDIDEIADKSSSLPHMIPSEEEFAKHVGALGISNTSHVVVYDASNSIGTAPRVLWTFRAFGHSGGVSILDGGLPKWKSEGLPVESGPLQSIEAKPYTAKLNKLLVRSFEQVRENIGSRESLILDARPAGRFTGVDPEPRPIPSGHMPNALSLPAPKVWDSAAGNTYFRGAQLANTFTEAGVNISSPTIHSCGSGVMASVTWLAQIIARMDVAPGSWEELEDGLSVYDGSWTEWASRTKEGATIQKSV